MKTKQFCLLAAFSSLVPFVDGQTIAPETNSAAADEKTFVRLEEIEVIDVRSSALTQAPTESRLDVVQPQSIIDISTITNSIAPSADYTMVANLSPSVTTIQANGPGLSE